MKKSIVLFLALLFPVCGFSGETVQLAYAGETNLTTGYNISTPVILAAAGSDTPAPAAYSGGSDEDLPFMDDDEIIEVYDPFETFNRGMFWFNDKLYFYLIKPIAKGMRIVIPEPLLLGTANFFSNLRTPIRMVNAALQGQFGQAGDELTRFGVNSTLGILGLFDPSREHFEIKKKKTDTGITMGYYGIGTGPYLVLPFLGPSNFRDGIGLFGDYYLNLKTHFWENTDYWIATGIDALVIVANDKDTYEGIKKDALDPYLFIRDAYGQHRQSKIDAVGSSEDFDSQDD